MCTNSQHLLRLDIKKYYMGEYSEILRKSVTEYLLKTGLEICFKDHSRKMLLSELTKDYATRMNRAAQLLTNSNFHKEKLL